MNRQVGILVLGVVVGVAGSACGVRAASAPKVPPAPPIRVTKFPKPTSRPRVPKIIHLKPGQKVITPEQMRKAPTVYVANQRAKGHRSGAKSLSEPLRIPGAPQLSPKLPAYPLKSTGPKPAPKPKSAAGKPHK
jgi:hypothetical protein